MRKIIALAAAALLTAGFMTGCGVQAVGDGQSATIVSSSSAAENSADENSSQTQAEQVTEDSVEDSLEGLKEYFTAKGYIPADATQSNLQANIIGAKEGSRYTFQYEGANVQMELYEFDLDNLDENAQKTIDEANTSGTMTVIGITATGTAVMSDSGKYLMFYNDPNTDEAHQAHTQEIIDAFKTFKS